ncbi:MAG TPA: aldo/keto reductase [Armatimonadota bacterium]|nr:aldo/keto reductase [Armatimonadota bacterium]
MNTLHIPILDRSVSRLGMGSMIFSPDCRDLVFELLDHFQARGGNLIDTAQVYGGGQSERAIGLYLAERGNRDQWVILDKGCENPADVHPAGIHAAIDCNLERLGIDCIDLWLLHRDNEATPAGAIVDALNEEVGRGRIRAFGGSNWTVPRLAEANAYAEAHGLIPMAVSSPHVCLATAIEPFWPKCTQASHSDLLWYAEHTIPVLAWSSQGRGFFLDYSGPDDRGHPDLVRVYHNESNFEKLRRVRELARARGVAPVEIALAYVLNLPAPIVALVGPATVAEIDSCVAASELEVTPDEMAWLDLRCEKA